jgi:diacylglycerol kinase
MKKERKIIESFKFAFEGVFYVLKTQPHMRFHFFVAILVLVLGILFHLDKHDILWIFISIIFVLITEMFNTMIEFLLDLTHPEIHPTAKIIKDMAAGGVLIASLNAIVAGILVFGPPLFKFLKNFLDQIYE